MNQPYLTVEQVARLVGAPIRTVRHNAAAGKYGEVRYEEVGAGRGGRMLLIPLSGLPAKVQADYFRTMATQQETPADLSATPEDARRELGERLETLAAWQAYRQAHAAEAGAHKLDKQFVQMWRESHPGRSLSVATLHRWEKARREQGESSLIDRRGTARAGETSVPDDLWAKYCALYLHQNKRSHMQCYRTVRDMASLEGRLHEVPSESAFRRRAAREFSREMLIFLREGPSAWYLKAAPYVDRDHTSVPPGGVFVMDHFQMTSPAGQRPGE
ncbi:MAG: hypothetical protein IMW99_03790 [Firmicutes bacterium]|nr:hypothetical protein [Bacillota bacterium]